MHVRAENWHAYTPYRQGLGGQPTLELEHLLQAQETADVPEASMMIAVTSTCCTVKVGSPKCLL